MGQRITGFVERIQNAYSTVTLLKLAEDGMQATLTTLSQHFDAVVNRILLEHVSKYIAALGSSGAAKIKARLRGLDDDSDDVLLYRATDNKYAKEKDDAAYRKGGAERAAAVKKAYPDGQQQPCTSMLELMVFSLQEEAYFKAEMTKLGELCGAEVKFSDRKGSSLKGLLRLYEKALLKAVVLGADSVSFALIFDVLRAMMVASTTAIAAKAQAVVCGGTSLLACRYKCRLLGKSISEWRDELINVLLTAGAHKLVGEIQIVRSKMLLQREAMGGHDGYDESRGLRGLYEACVALGHGSDDTEEEPTSNEDFDGFGTEDLGGTAVEKLMAKRDRAIELAESEAAKIAVIDRQIEAITGEMPFVERSYEGSVVWHC